ncbi:phage holin family protein [Patescibacteria group bacterium]|nr:phage holin family protein [Patescibacteria group bacterium]
MKSLFRKILFSSIAIFLTGAWNKGFAIEYSWLAYLKASIIIAFIYYLIIPISKLILLPFNIITMGLVSVIFYSLALYFLLSGLSLIQVKEWVFNGYEITRLMNIFLVAFSISTIINLMEKFV